MRKFRILNFHAYLQMFDDLVLPIHKPTFIIIIIITTTTTTVTIVIIWNNPLLSML